jgi:hypothetical protein
MEMDLDKGKKKETMDLIMMDEGQTNKIMKNDVTMCNDRPFQYHMNNKKRAIADKEGLASDEEEVEDIQDIENIEEILQTTYERKTTGPGLGTKV